MAKAPIRYFICKGLHWSPFRNPKDLPILRRLGVEETRNVFQAHFFVSDRPKPILPYALMFGPSRRYMIWSDEPRVSPYFAQRIPLLGAYSKAEAMTVYTGDVFFNEAYYFDDCGIDLGERLPPATATEFPAYEERRCVFLGQYRAPGSSDFSPEGEDRNIDLHQHRLSLALAGRKLDKCEIFGAYYPNGVAEGNSGAFAAQPTQIPEDYAGDPNNWQQVKLHLLRRYHFNIAVENTVHGDYITEKLWHAILGRCLPIYYGGNNIYNYFPRNSFIDSSKFTKPEDLYAVIDKMPLEEFLRRMNLCIDVYNKVLEREKTEVENTRYQRCLKIAQRMGAAPGGEEKRRMAPGDISKFRRRWPKPRRTGTGRDG